MEDTYFVSLCFTKKTNCRGDGTEFRIKNCYYSKINFTLVSSERLVTMWQGKSNIKASTSYSDVLYDLLIWNMIQDFFHTTHTMKDLLSTIHRKISIHIRNEKTKEKHVFDDYDNNQWYYISTKNGAPQLTRYNSTFTKCIALIAQLALLGWTCKTVIPKLITQNNS
jgi:hypothetical protein